jgi:acetylornithine deacetylase/succinyl-diaminopimelate desuccinylase-like protein
MNDSLDVANFNSISSSIEPEWLAQETLDMCQIQSVTMGEQEVCRHYANRLQALGLSVDEREVTPGRFNLYSRIPGVGGGPTLALNGHIDTVPIYNAWPPRRDGDRIHGRGATDMKGGMAAILGAARALISSGRKLKGDLLLSAVVGHEEAIAKKDGPRAFVADLNSGRVRADAILIAEGGEELWVMSMGSANFVINLNSDRGGTHTDNTPFELNPIYFLGKLIERFNLKQMELNKGVSHPLAGHERIDLGIVQAGDLYNRTPARCTLEGTRRWAPGKTVTDIREELVELIEPIAAAGRLTAEIVIEQEREPFETSAEHPAVLATRRAAEHVMGFSPRVIGRRIVGDANIYVNGASIPCYYFGPMNDTLHSDHEWVSIKQVTECAQIYLGTALGFCGIA